MHKGKIVAWRLVSVLPMLLIVSVLIFSVTYMIPGDPAITLAGDGATAEDIAQMRAQLGLDRPPVVRYFEWLGGLLQGDLGESLTDGRPVVDIIVKRIPPTLSLAFGAIAFATLVGVPLGILAATKRGSLRDRFCLLISTAGIAMPSFWLAILGVALFAVRLGWFPATGYVDFTESRWEWGRHLVLPVIALSTTAIAELARQTRAAVAATLDSDYVRTAQMKGLPRRRIIGLHSMKNAGIPIVTTLGLLLTILLSGSVVIERVFGIPGLGDLIISEVSARNIPVIQGIALLTTLLAVVVTLVVDIVTMILNPKLEMA